MRSFCRSFLSVAVLVGLLWSVWGTGTPSHAAQPWWDQSSPQAVDSQVNVTGAPATTPAGSDLRGLVDAHSHLMSNVGFGGNIVCGQTFSPKGIAAALVDCDNHRPDGSGALVENLTSLKPGSLFARHDPVGWPTFADWPAWSSLTHQQMYYRWVERSWRAGQRVLVADAVNNNVLCGLRLQRNTASCDDMDTVRRQIAQTRALEAFVDARHGGPGRGWFRIVESPEALRATVAAGKLAVVLGVEISAPFGCSQRLGVPQCTEAQINAGLDELHGLGVRSMFLCHKFDNALCGVRLDSGNQGVIVNAGNALQTGAFWQVESCPGSLHDNTVSGGVLPAPLAKVLPFAAVPVYPKGPHCNKKGLTQLGEYALRGMMRRGMLVEIDHMSIKAATRTLDIIEQADYPGLVSSHSWMAPELSERLYRRGGFIAQYGNDSKEFVKQGASQEALRKRYGVGYGFGMDRNGFGSSPRPHDHDEHPVTYPFLSPDGAASVDRQVTGSRTWDYNRDGLAHYGLVADWVRDLSVNGGAAGQQVVQDLMRGAESYARTWERARRYRAPINLATGAAASASSTEGSLFGSFAASRAVDGAQQTRWASRWRDGEYWQVDLRREHPVRRVTLSWDRAYARDYDVLVSSDGRSWRPAAQVRGSDGALDNVELAQPTSARWVRILGVRRASAYGISLNEVGVHAAG